MTGILYIFIMLGGILGLTLLAFMYYVTPYRLSIENIHIETEKQLNKEIKIVQLSDIHIGKFYNITRFLRIIKIVNQLAPDFVLITGDLIDNAHTFNHYQYLSQALSKIEARYAKVSSLGNHEAKYRDDIGTVLKMYQAGGFNCLVNRGFCIKTENLHMHIYGADCAMYGKRDVSFVSDRASDAFNLLLLHQPDVILDYIQKPLDLIVSGHTHNGQVNFWGFAPIKPRLGRLYLSGMYHHRWKGKILQHYVNRGLGVTHFPLRFCSVPEITVFEISHSPTHTSSKI